MSEQETYISNQDIFDAAWKHWIIEQVGKKSLKGRHCAYRGSNGLRCIIGRCIPDEVYDPSIEGLAPHALQEEYEFRFENVGEATNMQAQLHDRIDDYANMNDIESLKKHLIDTAYYFDLEVPAE